MKILLAEDDPVTLRLLAIMLEQWGLESIAVADGGSALDALLQPHGPRLAILDWNMPVLDGPAVCRRLRREPQTQSRYLILLTGRRTKEDVVTGLEAGADDFISKPCDRDELLARLHVGLRVVGLQQNLEARVAELENALGRVRQLQGLLPICCYCKAIRNDRNYWQQVEEYLVAYTDMQLSHGICPRCFDAVIRPQLETQALQPPSRSTEFPSTTSC